MVVKPLTQTGSGCSAATADFTLLQRASQGIRNSAFSGSRFKMMWRNVGENRRMFEFWVEASP